MTTAKHFQPNNNAGKQKVLTEDEREGLEHLADL